MEDEEDIVASLSSEKRELRSERPEESLQQCDTLSTAVEEIDQLKEVVEVHDELAGEGDGVRGLESENEVENVEEEPMEARDDLLTVDEGQVESVERVNEGENVEKAKDMEGEQVKEGGKDAITEEMKDDKKDGEEEALGSAKEVKRDGVVKAAEVPLMNEEVIAKDEGIVGEEREASSCANEVETDGIVNAEDVEIVDEKEKAVNVVELGEVKAEIDEQGKELKVEEDGKRVEEEEEAEEMDHSSDVTKNDESVVEEGTPIVDTEMETETETMKSGSGGKRKRGPKAKQTTLVKASSRKIVGEDVCFICLDGGNLVLCDRRGCPKAYHPSCVDHDDEFFKTKGRWNCGWHLCNQCGKNAYFMCYTCQFSLCKSCSKDAAIFCVRGNKGFCETCMKTVRLIEDSKPNDMGHDAFSDKSSWEYLFKDYWLQQKEKLCITSDELSQAKNPWKGFDKHQTSIEVHEGNNDAGVDSDSSLENKEYSGSKRMKSKTKSKSVDYGTDSSSEKDASTGNRKSRRRLKSQAKDVNSDSEHSSPDTSSRRGKKARRLTNSRSKGGNYRATDDFAEGNIEWASKELLEFVIHMKNGDQSVLTQFDVQGLLLEYIKRNKLRDPRRQSQIICDSMLQKLFGKPRVGHFEMLKLLESHFFLKDNSYADDNQGIVADTEMRQLNADDNTDSLLDGGKGRGRKSRKRGEERGSQSNLDDYAAIDMHNISLIFLRRNLMEALMGNSETFHDKAVGSLVRIRISGSSQKQDMYRLVQIIGTSKAAEPYKVGKRTTDVMLEILNLDKTEIISIDSISNQEFSEDECKRLRQSIKCGLINRMTVGDVLEKAKELHEVRVVDWLEAEIVRLSHLRDRASEKGRKKELRECVEKLQLLKTPEERQRRLDEIPKVHADPKMDPNCESEDELDSTRQARDERPRETGFTRRGRDHFSSREGGSASSDSWSANARPPNQKLESNRNSSGMDFSGRREGLVFTSPICEHTWSNGLDKGSPRSNSREKPRMASGSSIRAGHSGVRSDLSSAVVSESPSISSLAGQIDSKVSETEKMWHYRDPTGKVQGPFSMAQLRKWNSTGYFPSDLRIWRISQSENDSILLTDLLAGRFDKEVPSVGPNLNLGSALKNVSTSIDTSKLSGNARSSGTGGRYESSNLLSPTPARNSFQSSNQSRRGVERLPSPTPTSPSDPTALGRSNFSHQSKGGASGNRGENFTSSVQLVAGQHSFSSSGPRLDLSSSSGAANGLQIASQSTVQMATQPFTAPNSVINHSNLAQGLSNVLQPGTGQNPSVYTHGWSSGYVARPENVSMNMTPNNPNPMPAQVAYGQWTASTLSNQATSYGAAAYTGPGTIATNLPGVAAQNAWRSASSNMPWAGPGQQQQIVNQNMVWAGPPAGAAFVQSAGTVAGAVGQQAGSTPGASAMSGGPTTIGWSGAGPSPSPGSTNPGWAAQQGNATDWRGDQNRNGGGAQWNRQSSFGSRGPRVCKKGASCDYMHS